MTALPRFSDELHQYRPSSTTFEKSGLPASAAPSSLSSRAHNFVFSLQPPKKFVPSLAPNDSPVQSPSTASVQFYGDRSNLKNVSTSSLSVAEDAVSHKSGSSRLGKGKFNLNLRNPLSLLARRRSSQNQLPKAEEGNLNINTINVPSLPDDYDPRIRGKFVHDFSVPKAHRLNSYNGVSSAETSPSIDSRPSTQSNRRGSENVPAFGWLAGRTSQSPVHSPLFKEHFDDDRQPLQPQSTGYLHTLATLSATHTSNEPPKLPPFAKSLPLEIFGDFDQVERDATAAPVDASILPQQPDVLSQSSPGETPISKRSPSPVALSTSASSADKRPSPTHDFMRPIENLPKHMISTSSRFSFQLSGMDSEAQERLLEEKHKQHAASKISNVEDQADIDSEGSRYSDGDLGDDDGLEERIPGVNADSDDEVADDCQKRSLDSFHFTPTSALVSPSSVDVAESQPTPQDGEGQVIGFANTKVSEDHSPVPPSLQFNPKLLEQVPWFGGLGIQSMGNSTSPSWTGVVQELPPQLEDQQEDDDDLYWDDGNIAGLDSVSDGESFDEALFDDETGKILDIPAQNLRKLEFAQRKNPVQLPEKESFSQSTNGDSTTDIAEQSILPASPGAKPAKHAIGGTEDQSEVEAPAENLRNGLTEHNLAYQNALVTAANKAVAQGRFSRGLSMSQDSEDYVPKSQAPQSRLGLMSDDSHPTCFFDNADAEEERDEYPFDDCLEDDLMIAEANAEVLENDDEGFYGQEFGFYARAHGKGKSEMVNGGYFGPKGVEGVHRSHSAKANFQEPSLTPITERSEWSHRNSVASIHTLGLPQSAQAIPGPGIAQLLDLDSPSFEDEMSLSALMKLRRGAWGGSQTSLNSSGGSQAGSSPLAQLPLKESFGSQLAGFEKVPLGGNDFPRRSYDAAVLPEVYEEERSRQSSKATETQPLRRRRLSDADPQAAMQGPAPPSHPLSRSSHGAEKTAKSHSRASSGAESVSYVKDPEGSGRWLLERRRTGDDGELQLVEREYVAGARI
jgi:hypothetical protein